MAVSPDELTVFFSAMNGSLSKQILGTVENQSLKFGPFTSF